ncbi:tetratricopeptide repeat protein [Dyadobacter sp. CY356]|uniref:tetratricopeptide repeat protein n=1 Tax=Dyadobacter sp. CY356 TaxID=2906442 RepID=UPI001F30C681|nr:tetratricopeptide repeat protein [Dyadobacter sp. CY356]MCF0059173.1 tetratricopeptide repeat protein [Dyadobacter sp. CY356]
MITLEIKNKPGYYLINFFLFFLVSANTCCAQTPEFYTPLDYNELKTNTSFSRPDSVLLVLKENYNKAVTSNKELAAAGYLKQIGELLYVSGHYPQALDYLLRADKIYRNYPDKKELAENLVLLGELYYRSRQPAQARKEFNEALSHYQQLKLTSGMALVYGHIGYLYEKKQLYDSAFYFQNKALLAYKTIKEEQGIAKIYENIGSIYEDKEKYDSAYVYFNRAYLLNTRSGNQTAQIEILNNLGDVLRKTGKYRQGLGLSLQALNLALKKGEYYQLSSASNDVAKAYNFLNKNDSAFYYLSQSRQYLNDIYSQESNKQLALLQTLYEIEKKDNEIESLVHARQTDLLVNISAGVVIVLVLLLTGLIISRQRLKIKNEQKLHAQNSQVFQAQAQLMEAELENKRLLEENLTQQLEIKTKELTSYTLHVIRKNKLLEDLQSQLEAMVKEEKRDQKKQIKQLSVQISEGLSDDQHWEEFRGIFEQVHQSFFDRLQQQSDALTSNDLRLIALIKMNMTPSDISTLLGVSQDSLRVMRHRLRKKLNLAPGDNLSAFIQTI